jgi:MoxR-like ATPase
MFKIVIDYPTEEEEVEIVTSTTTTYQPEFELVLSGEDILKLHEIVRRVPAADNVVRYAVKLARATRPNDGDSPEFVQNWISWGAGPRAGQYLILGGKARAILRGRFNVSIEDVKSVAHAVLRHRILTNFHAEAEGVNSDGIIDRLLNEVKEPSM